MLLIEDRFPNRIENKRYLIILLERLLIECKKLATHPDKYTEKHLKKLVKRATLEKEKVKDEPNV